MGANAAFGKSSQTVIVTPPALVRAAWTLPRLREGKVISAAAATAKRVRFIQDSSLS
jgi:hypothetical protein